MANTKILKVDAEPTIFNKEMVIGLLTPFNILGGIVGGVIGKSRMTREKEQGRLVSDTPTSWNKDTLLGGLIGGLVAGIAGRAIVSVAAEATGVGLTTLAAVNPVLALTLVATSLAIGVAGLAIGAVMGARNGIANQKQDYEKAKHQEAERGISQAIALSQERGQGLEQQPSHSHAAQIESERSIKANNQQQR